MPLLLRGLALPDLAMRADVIETLSNAAEDPVNSGEGIQTAISEHSSSLVTAMLKNGQMHDNSISVGYTPDVLRQANMILSVYGG